MKAYLLTALLIFMQSILVAQTLTQTIRGTINDIDSEVQLYGATVVVLNTDPLIGSSTDFDGNFRLDKVPVGRHNIKISMLGYEEQIIPNVQVGSGKEIVLHIKLRESMLNMKTVEITDQKSNKSEANNELATVSARQFSVEETKRYAGALNDPGRMALSFAGVAAANDMSNEIVIRGNSPRGLLWRMEGIEIPNPNHFSNQGSAGGAISMLSNNMMANSDFFTGAFPADYGNAASGVFDIRLRKGNNEKRESALQIGVLGTDLALEGPFKKGYQGSYLINYRYSSLALLQRAGLEIVGDAVPNFQDLSYNVFLPTKKYGNFSLFGIAGLSRINQEFPTKTFISKSTYKTTMAVGGITHAYTIGDKALIKTVVAYTSTSSNYNEKEHDTVEVFRRTLFDENFNNTAFRTSSYLNYKINASQSIKFGVIHSLLGYNMDANWYNRHENLHEQLLQSKGNTAMFQSYVNWRNRITDKITLNTGLHYTKFLLNNKQTIEPRAGIKWALDARQNISAGFGIHSRAEDPSFYMIQRLNNNDEYEQINRDLDFSKARHYMLGYERLLTENLNLKAET